jgi:hypothetical protein
MIEAALKRSPGIADTPTLLQEIWKGEQAA